jgi:hypothetical protein
MIELNSVLSAKDQAKAQLTLFASIALLPPLRQASHPLAVLFRSAPGLSEAELL